MLDSLDQTLVLKFHHSNEFSGLDFHLVLAPVTPQKVVLTFN